MGCFVVVLLQYVQRIAVMVLHADGTKDGPYGACGAALLPDHLTHVCGGDPEPKHRTFLTFHRFDIDCFGSIYQRAGNLSHKFLHVIGSVCRLFHMPPMGRHKSYNLRGYADTTVSP